MKTLIKNVTLLTMGHDSKLIQDSSIFFTDDLITAVGDIPQSFVPDEIIDGRNCLVMPALYNAHTHAAMTLERGWAEDLAFEDWLNKKIWVAESALEEDDIYWGTSLAALEMIKTGVVGFADHYFWMDHVARVIEESGMKGLLAWCHFGTSSQHELGGISFDETMSFVNRWNNAAHGRIRTVVGPHSPYMVPQIVLEKYVGEACRFGVGAHIHLSESNEQMINSINKHGKTPVAYLNDIGLFDLPAPTLVAHCNVLDEGDYDILCCKNVYVAHTPKTYMKLAMKMPDVPRLLRSGVKVALGTDGPASNSDFNMWEVIRLTGLVQKYLTGDPTEMERNTLLNLAVNSPAEAMGFTDTGVLKAGKKADLIMMDLSAPHWFPHHDILAGLVYTASPADVKAVWCDGNCLYRNGEFLTLDYERICYEAEKRSFRMTGKPMQQLRRYQG